jgi:hypothetical protein
MSESETYYVYGLMDLESQGGFVELWSGPYASCVDFVNAPQFQLDLEMGVYVSFVIWDEEDLSNMESMIGYVEGETVH